MLKGFLKLSNIDQKLKSTFFDFPLVVLFIITAVIFAFFKSHDILYFTKELQEDFLYTLILSIVPLVSFRLFVKSLNINFLLELIASIAIVLFTAYNVLYFNTSSFFLVVLNIVSLSFAPFLFKKTTNKAFLLFNYDTFYAVIFALISSLILLLGLNAIFASIAYLFEFSLPSYVYKDIGIISMLGLFPLLVLSNISRDFVYENYELYLTNPLQILVKNILVPLLYIYMIILYLYFFKILFEGSLPKGNLASMIISFGSIGILTKILIFPMIDKSSKLIKFYDKYYYHTMLIPIGMLLVSFYRRVSDYGITEARYSIGLFILWFTFVSLFAIVKKERFNLKYIVISLFTLCFLALLGPISATNISAKSQLERFYKILEEKNILIDGKIKASKKEQDMDTRIQISSLVSYLSKNEAARKEMLELFPSLADKKYLNSSRILEILNVKHANIWMRNNDYAKDRITIRLTNSFVSIKDFDYVIRSYISRKIKTTLSYENKEVEVLLDNKILTISFNKEEKVSFDLEEYTQNLRKRKISIINEANKKEAILTRSTNTHKVELRLYRLDRYRDEINFLETYILIKKIKL